MTLVALTMVIGLFLAYSSGSNDNYKGVATLYASNTLTYRGALALASVAQLLGSLAATYFAEGLIAKFSGKGLVPDTVVALRSFSLAVGLAAAATVALATRLGLPISTTHALTGALVGAGWWASSEGVDLSKLGTGFFTPLLISPVVAAALAAALYLIYRKTSQLTGLSGETCVCPTPGEVQTTGLAASTAAFQATHVKSPGLHVADVTECEEKELTRPVYLQAAWIRDAVHCASGGAVCFARALNDTPKIAASLLIGSAIDATWAMILVSVAMLVGGIINSRRLAKTLAHKITVVDASKGLSANLVSAGLVGFASKLGMPVSTTHVSVGSLFGIAAATRNASLETISKILLAWVTTLPIAAAFGALLFLAFR